MSERPAIVVCRCPYCARPVTEAQRLRYPDVAAMAYTPVYRCNGCRRIFGSPVASYAGVSLRKA